MVQRPVFTGRERGLNPEVFSLPDMTTKSFLNFGIPQYFDSNWPRFIPEVQIEFDNRGQLVYWACNCRMDYLHDSNRLDFSGSGQFASLNLARFGTLQKQLHRFLKILPGRLYRVALAGYVKLGTKRNIAIAFALDDRGHLLELLHGSDSRLEPMQLKLKPQELY